MVGRYDVAPIIGGVLIGFGLVLSATPAAATAAVVIFIWYIVRKIGDSPWPWE